MFKGSKNADLIAISTLLLARLGETDMEVESLQSECRDLNEHINRDHAFMDDQQREMSELKRQQSRINEDYLDQVRRLEDRVASLNTENARLRKENHTLRYGEGDPTAQANAYMVKDGSRIARIVNPNLAEGKIGCIKVVREITGWGLKEAKDFVEDYLRREDALKDEEVGSGTKRSQQLPQLGAATG